LPKQNAITICKNKDFHKADVYDGKQFSIFDSIIIEPYLYHYLAIQINIS